MKSDFPFGTPNDIFEENLNSLFGKKPTSSKSVLMQIVSILIYSDKENSDLAVLYDELGIENFSKLINVVGGKPLVLPDRSEFQDKLMLAVCFYYKEIEGMNWRQIEKLFPHEIPTRTYGRQIKELRDSMKNSMADLFKTYNKYPEGDSNFFKSNLEKQTK